MVTPVFSFGSEQLNRLFPFYLLIDHDLQIIAHGRSISKLCHIEDGASLTAHFIINPPIPQPDFDSVKHAGSNDIFLHAINDESVILKGRFEYLSAQKQLLFIGTPYVSSADEMAAHHFNKNDFAYHDSLYDKMQQDIVLKDTRNQLRMSENRYRGLFNYSQTFIYTHDLNGKLLTVNPAICEKLGYSAEELKGRMLTDFIPKSDLVNFRQEYLDKVIEKGSAKGIFRVLGKTAKNSFLLYENFKVEEENNEPYIIGISQDITERILVEKELRKAKQVTDHAAKAKEIFLANMSHEIRTPMSGIIGIVKLLSKTPLNEQQQKFTELISESANSLLAIVNDVLDIEKIASGKFNLESIPFKLEEKVYTTVQSFQFKAEEKNIQLSFKSNIASDLVVLGDPSRLGQILNNLLSNALKFTPKGEIYVSLFYKKNDAKSAIIEFEVADTGIGIKPDKLSAIFKPYVQASNDVARRFGGTGLGLSISKNLIEMQGGSISVDSKVNKGTTFTFHIPYEKGNAKMLTREHDEDLDYKILQGTRVLVAEDWELNQFLVQNILQSWGCEITLVNNGKEALDEMKKHEFDVILMDIHMPEMDGITASRKIRAMANEKKASIPIIALTANTLKGDFDQYQEAGINDSVTKPYTEEKLFITICNLLKPENNLKEIKTSSTSNIGANFIEQSNVLYDLSFVNEFAKGDISFIKSMVVMFMDAMSKEVKELVEVEQEGKYDKISKIAHKLKSAIDGLGIHSLRDIVRELETTPYVEGGEYQPKVLIDKIKTTLDEAFVQLDAFIKL